MYQIQKYIFTHCHFSSSRVLRMANIRARIFYSVYNDLAFDAVRLLAPHNLSYTYSMNSINFQCDDVPVCHSVSGAQFLRFSLIPRHSKCLLCSRIISQKGILQEKIHIACLGKPVLIRKVRRVLTLFCHLPIFEVQIEHSCTRVGQPYFRSNVS